MKPATLRPFLSRSAFRQIICISRGYAIQSPGSPTLQVFNRHAKYLQKERAASDAERSRQTDYLKDEVAIRLSERLLVSVNGPTKLQLLRN
jgi:NADH dehydrogenase [ubiquinone] 1 alpha subcomplex assembly factor 5